jgi:2Fe-2S ferredoxin
LQEYTVSCRLAWMGEEAKHRVEILPIGLTLMVPDGEAIMAVALANGWRWPNVCGGQASCGVCLLEIQQGLENASPIGRDEAVRLTAIRRADKPGARLACQMRVSGPMCVLKRGARLMGEPTEQAASEEGAGTR